jgi:C4-dicarboxylate-specific signal transduction histidine kinase
MPPSPSAATPPRRAATAAARGILARAFARAGRPRVAIPLAVMLVALIGAADYATGYEVRLAILYMVPVALATWTCGRAWGAVIAALGLITWATSFATQHPYSHAVYYFWECMILGATLLLFVELFARLRTALARSDERFVRVLDSLYAAVYVTDDDNDRVLYANRRFAQLMGGEGRTPTAADIAGRFVIGKPEGTSVEGASPEFRFTGVEARDVVDGRWYIVQAGFMPWVDRSRVRLNVMTDISDQKLAQKLHIEHQSALHHTARLINLAEAATTLAHELNQPLLAIVAYNAACIRLLESGSVDLPTVGAAMKKCRTQAVRAGEIVRRMRELARRRAPQLADCDLNAMIRQQLEWSEDDLAGAGVTVEPDLEVALPHVQADRLLIEQVLVNLVQNAIDAMRNTDPAQRALRIGSRRADQGRVTITVADRGEGIAPAVGERLFSTFFTTKATGLGLGLSICRSVIELHGGRLWHDANPGGGTAFHFTLPEESA